VREREQLAAIEELGIGAWTRSRFLGLPDYHLPDVPFDELVEALVHVMREFEPQVVVTFGPDGMTSHHDHIRVGQACTEAFDRAQASSRRPPRYLFHTALPRSAVDLFYTELGDTRYGKEGDLFNVAGIPDERIAVRFDARPFHRTKLDAILAHRTQICEWERIPESLRWIFLDTEAFVQARPSTDAAEPRADLFEGLQPRGT
jgi:LmbE family N-acetylglucosaminyl deacetylase